MERSEYFNYTRPSQTQLNNTEDSKIRGILRRARSNLQFGTRTGFRITINAANALQIDIGAGDGFTGGFYKSENLRGSPNSGERISTLTDAATGESGYTKSVTGLGLVDYSANTLNYVCLRYVEAETTPLAERYYPFTSHNTIVAESYLAVVYTEAQWNALTTLQLENMILVGIVTAQGAGNPLSLANIEQMIQPKSHPVAGTQPSNITGVTITGVSDETLIGNGTLRFETATKKIYWTAPGDAEGTGVVMGSSGTFTLYSDDTSYWIFIDIIFAGLPAADSTDTIRIESLYGRTVPMACAVDQAHRDMLGTGVLSLTNPHGTGIDDITGGTFEHAELYHVNGISGDAQADQLQCSINAANNSIEIINNGSSRNSFLIDGISYNLLAGYAAGIVGRLTFSPIVPILDSGDYLIYIDSSGEPQYVKIAEYTPGAPGDTQVLFSANIQIHDMHNEASGNGRIDWNNTTFELWYTAPGDAAGTRVRPVARANLGHTGPSGFYKLYSNNGIDWVLVYCNGGALGATANSVFAIDKNETEHPDDSMLKIGVVTWTQLDEAHANLRDIRRFNTADNRDEVEEDHDERGQHTKVLQNAFRVNVGSVVAGHFVAPNTALFAYAATHTAIAGDVLGNTAIRGAAFGNIGVYGYAGINTGGYFSAGGDIGVAGIADDNTGGYFSAGNDFGARATADRDFGGAFYAGQDRGVFGSAARSHGGHFIASATGVYAFGSDTGVYGIAGELLNPGDVGVYGLAWNDYGGRFSAKNDFGVSAKADNDFGVYGEADSYGVSGLAAANYGGYFRANGNNATGLVGTAFGAGGAEIGVFGRAIAAGGATGVAGSGKTGVYGNGEVAAGIGGYFTANVIGARGYASATGIHGSATDVGVFGLGAGGGAQPVYGGQFQGLNAVGVGVRATGVSLGAWIENLIRYDVVIADAGVAGSYIPIIIGGVPYKIRLYANA